MNPELKAAIKNYIFNDAKVNPKSFGQHVKAVRTDMVDFQRRSNV